MELKTGAATVENSTVFPQKIKNGTALEPSDSTSGYMPEKPQDTNLREYMHPYIHCSIILNSQDMEAT